MFGLARTGCTVGTPKGAHCESIFFSGPYRSECYCNMDYECRILWYYEHSYGSGIAECATNGQLVPRYQLVYYLRQLQNSPINFSPEDPWPDCRERVPAQPEQRRARPGAVTRHLLPFPRAISGTIQWTSQRYASLC